MWKPSSLRGPAMFEVESPPGGGRKGRRVVDHERGVYLQSVAGVGRQSGTTFILVHDNGVIPFETLWESGLRDPATREPYFIMRFSSFGISDWAAEQGYNLRFDFADDAEKHYWMRIAAEALVIYGPAYDGIYYKDGYTRVELDGELLRLSSFGYTPIKRDSAHWRES